MEISWNQPSSYRGTWLRNAAHELSWARPPNFEKSKPPGEWTSGGFRFNWEDLENLESWKCWLKNGDLTLGKFKKKNHQPETSSFTNHDSNEVTVRTLYFTQVS
jgi:hypothetical protein